MLCLCLSVSVLNVSVSVCYFSVISQRPPVVSALTYLRSDLGESGLFRLTATKCHRATLKLTHEENVHMAGGRRGEEGGGDMTIHACQSP